MIKCQVYCFLDSVDILAFLLVAILVSNLYMHIQVICVFKILKCGI